MANILLIGFGGFLGAISRFLLNEIVIKYIPLNFPTGILIVNVLGCLFIGFALGNSVILKDHLYYFLAVGFLGSFTTMSAFSYQTLELFNTNILIACSYIILTLTLTILATYIGINFSK
jgi:CrcB protein